MTRIKPHTLDPDYNPAFLGVTECPHTGRQLAVYDAAEVIRIIRGIEDLTYPAALDFFLDNIQYEQQAGSPIFLDRLSIGTFHELMDDE